MDPSPEKAYAKTGASCSSYSRRRRQNILFSSTIQFQVTDDHHLQSTHSWRKCLFILSESSFRKTRAAKVTDASAARIITGAIRNKECPTNYSTSTDTQTTEDAENENDTSRNQGYGGMGQDEENYAATPTTAARAFTRGSQPSHHGEQGEIDPETKKQATVLIVSQLFSNLGFAVIIPILPVFTAELGLGASGVGVMLSAPALARLLCNLPFGKISDKYGRKPLMVIGPLINAIGTAGTALAPNLGLIVLARLMTGLGSSASMAGAGAYMADITARYPNQRAKVIGMQQVAFTVAFTLGPACGGMLADAYGHKNAIFFTAALISVTGLGFSRLPETISKPSASLNFNKFRVCHNSVYNRFLHLSTTTSNPCMLFYSTLAIDCPYFISALPPPNFVCDRSLTHADERLNLRSGTNLKKSGCHF